MAFVIDKDICIGCGTCEEECPVGSISVDEDGKYIIDPETCIDCGSCAAVCPVDAVKE